MDGQTETLSQLTGDSGQLLLGARAASGQTQLHESTVGHVAQQGPHSLTGGALPPKDQVQNLSSLVLLEAPEGWALAVSVT